MLNIKSLVVLSGGQDSTTCLYWALHKFGSNAVETITFDYGQRHRVELDCAANVAEFARYKGNARRGDSSAIVAPG